MQIHRTNGERRTKRCTPVAEPTFCQWKIFRRDGVIAVVRLHGQSSICLTPVLNPYGTSSNADCGKTYRRWCPTRFRTFIVAFVLAAFVSLGFTIHEIQLVTRSIELSTLGLAPSLCFGVSPVRYSMELSVQ